MSVKKAMERKETVKSTSAILLTLFLVRNLGNPVEMAHQYYLNGADEITFLNITSFRSCPLQDLPILSLLHATSENVFVPLTIGGGIRDFIDPDGSTLQFLLIVKAKHTQQWTLWTPTLELVLIKSPSAPMPF